MEEPSVTTISRRQLFRGELFRQAPAERTQVKEWVRLGRISEFPPELTRDVVVFGQFIKIISLAEGLRAELETSSGPVFLPLRLATGGWVEAELGGGPWASNFVLNILTGEKYSLN